jgi:phosphoglycerate dehydrogenase-like enzyme
VTGFTVAATSPVPHWVAEAARERGVQFVTLAQPLEPGVVAQQLGDLRPEGYLLNWPDLGPVVTGELADAAGSLRVVTYAGQSPEPAFYLEALDLAALHWRGIVTTTMPGSEYAVAESAMALLFAFELGLLPANAARKRALTPSRSARRDGLFGSRLGIVGMGRIGHRVAELAAGCGMEVSYFSRTRRPGAEEALGVRYLHLPELFAWANHVSLHLPLSLTGPPITDNVLTQADGITLVDTTSHPTSVDPEALLRALEQGRVARFGLEGTYGEPYDTKLRGFGDDRVLLMPPYSSYDTPQAERLGWERYLESLRAVRAGRHVPYQVMS